MVKNLPANARDAGDMGLIPGLGRCPGGGNGNPLQYSSLENSMDREACWAYSLWVHKEADTSLFSVSVSLLTFLCVVF